MTGQHPLVVEARSLLQHLTPGDRRLVERYNNGVEYFVAYGESGEDSTLPPIGDARFDVAAPRLVRELLASLDADSLTEFVKSVKLEHVHCMRCGKRCSGVDPELGLVVRAWVECPECIERSSSDVGPPGRWICPTCGFTLTKAILRASDGAVGVDASPVQDICQNDGSSLRQVTWKEDAEDANLIGLGQMKRADVAEVKLSNLFDSLTEIVALYDGSRDMLGPDIRHKLARAEAALAKASPKEGV